MRYSGAGTWAEYANEIRRSVPTRALCEQVGVRLNREGSGLCPFHGDHATPSLKVYADPKRGWHCFGCGANGSVIDFAMQWYGIGFRQAVMRLDDMFALGLPLNRRESAQERRKRALEAERQEREREELEAKENDLGAEYWRAYKVYQATAALLDQEKPKRPEEEFSDWYAEALWALPIVRDAYERAQDAWMEVRKVANGTSAARLYGG